MTALAEPPDTDETPPRARGQLPPGPPLPRVMQTLGFIFGGARFLDACRRRYGDAVFMRTLFDDGFVMVFDPALVKQVFQGAPRRLHAGEANVLLGPILGQRSVLLLDGEEHLRHRRLLLPPFHGARLQAWTQTILDAADGEIDAWPVGKEFPLMPSMQALTLRVIVQAVFGYDPGADSDELTRRLRAMIEPLARPRAMMIAALLSRFRRGEDGLQAEFAGRRRAVDELLLSEIRRRRRDPELDSRDDVFSALLTARDEEGRGLSDEEIRDELLTLLLAGHETTATALAWTFDLLLHNPAVHAGAIGGDERYLDAVVKESLRMRPVIPAVGRVVRGAPFALGEHEVPVGMEINPSIRTIHRRADLFPEPDVFWPERFLGDDAPDTYTWLPFGGGTRRCLGASFALMEMRLVTARILARTRLQAARPELDPVQMRAITQAPKHGVRVRLDTAPAAV